MEAPNKIFGSKGIVIYHRPIGYYLERLIRAGFILTEFKEIHVVPDGSDPEGEDFIRYKKEIPSFLVCEVQKPIKY